jgi:hypothetical protein
MGVYRLRHHAYLGKLLFLGRKSNRSAGETKNRLKYHELDAIKGTAQDHPRPWAVIRQYRN